MATTRITLIYRCRDIGYGVEEGALTGHWTGEVDPWGKRTFQPDSGAPLYLFPDEIVEELDTPPNDTCDHCGDKLKDATFAPYCSHPCEGAAAHLRSVSVDAVIAESEKVVA